jgi:flagellar biosynthesis/type III secretory pathway protein FliH
LAHERAALLERQKRMAQYRFQQEYLERVRQQQIYLRDHRFDYDHDPYFYTAPIYRYNRGGRFYEINDYGAKMLRQAVNYGYEEGFRAGKADREDRWSYNYEDSYAYRDANYGYSGYYIERDDYNYYFREGFQRGYEDGFNSSYRYGRFVDGTPSILETIMSQILNFQWIS